MPERIIHRTIPWRAIPRSEGRRKRHKWMQSNKPGVNLECADCEAQQTPDKKGVWLYRRACDPPNVWYKTLAPPNCIPAGITTTRRTMLDENYKVPAGFEPVLNYPDGVNGIPVVGLAQLQLGGDDRALQFDIGDGTPKLPLKKHGEIWHTGWDIPTRYAIDAEDGCWKDNAHGHALSKVPKESLLSEPEQEHERNELRRLLGVELPMPEWAATAIRHGFTPPPGWTWKK